MSGTIWNATDTTHGSGNVPHSVGRSQMSQSINQPVEQNSARLPHNLHEWGTVAIREWMKKKDQG